jgi:hypothetical protein
MTQVVSRQPLTAEARVRVRISPCGICGQSGTGAGFPPSTSVLSCQYNSTVAPFSYIIWDMFSSHKHDMNNMSSVGPSPQP